MFDLHFEAYRGGTVQGAEFSVLPFTKHPEP